MEVEGPENLFEKSPIIIGKNVDFFEFILKTSAFCIEKYFMNMDWISIATMEECAYPNFIKEFYKYMCSCHTSGNIS